jgi:hypothetical protein
MQGQPTTDAPRRRVTEVVAKAKERAGERGAAPSSPERQEGARQAVRSKVDAIKNARREGQRGRPENPGAQGRERARAAGGNAYGPGGSKQEGAAPAAKTKKPEGDDTEAKRDAYKSTLLQHRAERAAAATAPAETQGGGAAQPRPPATSVQMTSQPAASGSGFAINYSPDKPTYLPPTREGEVSRRAQ